MKKNKISDAVFNSGILKALLFMKLTIAILLISLVQVSARGFSQTMVTLKLNDVELRKVLSQIENKTECRFLYNDETIANHKVNIDVENVPVTDALNQVFSGTNITYKVMNNNLIVLSTKDNSINDIKVTGKVTDAKGEAIPFATIRVKGTNIVTKADESGKFSIASGDNDILIISSVGYNQEEIVLGGRKELSITLKESEKALDQVVVVGYGTQRKIDVTGAVSNVKGEELVKQPVLTATQAIQGKVAGVQIISSGQPGSQPSVRIRGTGSILGGAEPLYVVDGIITTDITNINTADIVNVDILKDASSTAIYGARGANGVIIITTRQGRAGNMKITYNFNVGIQSAANLVKMADAQQYAAYVSATTFGLVNVPQTGYSTNWYNQILRNALEVSHNVSISGASDKTKYLLSFGFANDEGIVMNNDYKRFTIRSNNEFKLSDHLKLGILASYANGNNQNVNLGTAYNDAYRSAPLLPGIVNGKYGNTSLYQNVGNPILDINNNDNNTIDNRLQGNLFLEYKPIEWLTLKSSIGGDLDNNFNRVYNYAFAADTATFITAGGNQSNTISSLSNNSANGFNWVWENTVTFNKRFDKHSFTVLAGTTAEKNSSSFTNASAKGVPPQPNLWYIGNANFTLPFSTNGQGAKLTRNSYFARVNYSYNNRYLVTANFRADGSSNFPVNNRWGYFPSIGAGWVLSKEKFMDNQHLFDQLKLKASYGQAGNDATGAGAAGYTSTLLTGLPYYYSGTAVSGSIPSQIVDKNLKWETTTESDIAVEFSMLHSRLSGEVSYYSKVTSNSLIYVLIPSTLGSYNPNGGAGYVLTNAASVQNKGVEIALNWRDKINKDFSYSIGGNITFNQNEVVGLNGGQPFIDGPVGADQPYVTRTDNGHPIGSYYVQKVIGVFQSQNEVLNYTDKNGKELQSTAEAGDLKYQFTNGKIDSVYAGSYQPKAFYGINIGFNYKKFDFSLAGYGTVGGMIYNGKKAFRQSLRDNIEASTAENQWTTANHSNSEPRANGGDLPASTYFVEPGSYFRINNLNVGYTFSSGLLQKTKFIKTLRIYASCQNILTISKYTGFTPELQSSSPTSAGIELNAYPSVKTFSIGANVGF